jgi:hypothetical protein
LGSLFRLGIAWEKEVQKGFSFPLLRFWLDRAGLFPFVLLIVPWFYLSILEKQILLVVLLDAAVFHIWLIPGNDAILTFYPVMFTLGPVLVVTAVGRMVRNVTSHRAELVGHQLGAWIVVFMMCVLSGAMGLRALLRIEQHWTSEETRLASWITGHTERDAVFWHEGGFLNFLAVLTGRQSYAANRTVLRHEGIFMDEDEVMEMEMFLKGRANEGLRCVDWVVRREGSDWDVNRSAWRVGSTTAHYIVFKRNG